MARRANAAATTPTTIPAAAASPTRRGALTAMYWRRNRASFGDSATTVRREQSLADDGFQFFHRYRLDDGDSTPPG